MNNAGMRVRLWLLLLSLVASLGSAGTPAAAPPRPGVRRDQTAPKRPAGPTDPLISHVPPRPGVESTPHLSAPRNPPARVNDNELTRHHTSVAYYATPS